MGGQDAQGFIPYDPKASLKDQVRLIPRLFIYASPTLEQVTASFENSLKELQTSYIDSYLLHGPERTIQRNVEALTALQPYLVSNKLRYVGISNIYDVDGYVNVDVSTLDLAYRSLSRKSPFPD